MKSQFWAPAFFLAVCAMAIGMNLIYPNDQFCPNPSAASVTALFAPCQGFNTAMGRSVSKQEAVQMGLLTPDLQPLPLEQATQLALNFRHARPPLQQPQTGTVGLAKPRPKGDRVIP
jgi:hypothetical protein